MYCEKCGVKNDVDAKFCISCGEPMGISSVQVKQKKSKFPFIIVGAVLSVGILIFLIIFISGKSQKETQKQPTQETTQAVAHSEEKTTVDEEEDNNVSTNDPIDEILMANVGDVVSFGTYGITYREYEYRDEFTVSVETYMQSNSKTPIEWIVLENDGSSVTLLSKYILDNIPYNYEWLPMTWENSYIRLWLNTEFYDAAFDESEKSHIQTTTCVNEDNPYYGTAGKGGFQPGEENYSAGGNDTQDKVYLLSLSDVEKYFGVGLNEWISYCDGEMGNEALGNLCVERSGGILIAEHPGAEDYPWWWLRSPGMHSIDAAYVHTNGVIQFGGVSVNDHGGVRPVIRVGR